jgi:hypothetical protein
MLFQWVNVHRVNAKSAPIKHLSQLQCGLGGWPGWLAEAIKPFIE